MDFIRRVLVLITAFSMLNAHAYVVQSGETISSIAVKELKKPREIYGPHGRISLLISLNPQLKNPDRIFPRDQIFLEAQSAEMERMPAATETAAPESAPSEAAPPLAPALPSPTVIQAPPPPPEKDMRLVAQISQIYARTDAVDRVSGAKGVFISDLLTSASIGVLQKLIDRHELGVQIGWRENKFSAPTTGHTLGKEPSTKSIYVDYRYQASPRLRAELLLGIEQRLFVRAATATSYVFDVPQVPFAQLGLNYLFLHTERKDLGVSVNYRMLGAASSAGQEISRGSEKGASIFLRQRRAEFEFGQEVFYINGEQNSSIVEQSETSFGIRLGVGYRW